MDYPSHVKQILLDETRKLSESPERLAKRPGKDFTRNRKLPPQTLLRFLLSMEAGSIQSELLQHFRMDDATPSVSAFCQQRSKLHPDAVPSLFHAFNSHFPSPLYRGRYHFLAVDGTELNIARNPDDADTFHPPSKRSLLGFNQIHMTASYDLMGRHYCDAVIQPGRKKDEFRAICDLADRRAIPRDGHPAIYAADRGFASYNVFAHIQQSGDFFLARAKDVNVCRILGVEQGSLPDRMDVTTEVILTRSQASRERLHPELSNRYRFIGRNGTFDFLAPGAPGEYRMRLRIVRFPIGDGSFENIITNLPTEEFTTEDIQGLYRLRWGIETSFRELKHTIGAVHLHAKQRELIDQELWARLILYNFCEVITTHVIVEQKKRKYAYQVNCSLSIKICRTFLRDVADRACDIEGLIRRHLLPIRPGRSYPRRHRPQNPMSFTYRSA